MALRSSREAARGARRSRRGPGEALEALSGWSAGVFLHMSMIMMSKKNRKMRQCINALNDSTHQRDHAATGQRLNAPTSKSFAPPRPSLFLHTQIATLLRTQQGNPKVGSSGPEFGSRSSLRDSWAQKGRHRLYRGIYMFRGTWGSPTRSCYLPITIHSARRTSSTSDRYLYAPEHLGGIEMTGFAAYASAIFR